ncbi:MAG: sulfur carrier protein ThiS [Verrucomicrobia bacterium]|jgi:sulfur carrier protein|nr:sulfur carrier protein ThiS [Verrucomicrobiota bacterium]
MKLTLNGEARELESGASVCDLLSALQLKEKLVLVEINGQAIQRNDFQSAKLADGDSVEIVRMVGGG